ncbi:MAG: cytochrome c [Gemmatimonadetes bacterium]|nr:cytochrome c [Gemmatimonadota bacterium]
MRIFALLLVLVALGGRTAAAQQGGKAVYDRLCAACHGALGLGDGAAAKALKPPPTSFADPKFLAERTDEQLAAAVANGKPPMPPFSRQLSPAQIKELVAYIRQLGAPAK